MTPEEKKEIQKQRIKRFFIDATKDLLREEGLNSISTKKIGDKAGYSYATIYNYFSNFNELICISLEELANEMKEVLEESSKNLENNIGKLLELLNISIDYTIQNQHVYKLFLSTTIDYNYFKYTKNKRFIHPAYNLLISTIKNLKEFSNFSDEDIQNFADLVFTLFHSKIQFFLIQKYPENIENLKQDIFNNLNFLIKNTIR
ncbi:TetR family transcriptional regulator [Hypnocyclicus thermotrophus]|uniref:TetR family transcriptional regulator n=1 Tax=Hypnocyclicus thermotrophus TaxID=1627895 RepID=A0AA46E011_9FUSO|nr:TetR/AcrR family transcriptional regulator [Hypnocyclicus thermotrophus]TDT72269.1 TetR family transcriptional regulator [Hypnocyclicus thermotrophus]